MILFEKLYADPYVSAGVIACAALSTKAIMKLWRATRPVLPNPITMTKAEKKRVATRGLVSDLFFTAMTILTIVATYDIDGGWVIFGRCVAGFFILVFLVSAFIKASMVVAYSDSPPA